MNDYYDFAVLSLQLIAIFIILYVIVIAFMGVVGIAMSIGGFVTIKNYFISYCNIELFDWPFSSAIPTLICLFPFVMVVFCMLCVIITVSLSMGCKRRYV